MLAAVWWRRANAFGATAGMLVGFVIALFLAAADLRDPTLLGWLDPVGLAGPAGDLGIERVALAAVPAALLTIVLVSLVTPSPPASQLRFADELRSPRDLSADDGE
jgi:cation/acetate symporter